MSCQAALLLCRPKSNQKAIEARNEDAMDRR
jgi:hypothetical protein